MKTDFFSKCFMHLTKIYSLHAMCQVQFLGWRQSNELNKNSASQHTSQWNLSASTTFLKGQYPDSKHTVVVAITCKAYARATVTPDASCICDPHHSSWQRWILNPLSEARDLIRKLMVPSRICFCCATTGTPNFDILNYKMRNATPCEGYLKG